MILSGDTIRALGIISPHVGRGVAHGLTYGESLAGYDIRLGASVLLSAGTMSLGVSLERFAMPKNVAARVHDKSTNARRGVFVQNTFIEPGWEGWLTLEISLTPLLDSIPLIAGAHGEAIRAKPSDLVLDVGMPIAQVVFEFVDSDTAGYRGKYNNQPQRPVNAIFETG